MKRFNFFTTLSYKLQNRNHLFVLLITILFGFIPIRNYGQCLSGSKTIGGINPDYADLTVAALAIQQNGLCGPLTLLVRPGIYDEDFNICCVDGSSSVNTITLRSETGIAEDVILQAHVPNDNSGVIRLAAVSYMTIENLTISPSAQTDGFTIGVLAANFSDHITIRNVVFRGKLGTQNGNSLVLGLVASNISISDCVFEQNNTGIEASTWNPRTSQWSIRNNSFSEIHRSIYVRKVDTVMIADNTIEATPTSGNGGGISSWLSTFVTVKNNIILSGNAGIGLHLSGTSCHVSNNVLSGFQSDLSQSVGLVSIDGADSVEMLYNTFRVNAPGLSDNAPMVYLQNNEHLHIANNIITMGTPSGYAMRFDELPQDAIIDHNVYYGGRYPILIGFNNEMRLRDWHEETEQDLNSQVNHPEFVSDVDLHLKPTGSVNQLLDGKASSIASLLADFDDVLRDPVTPDPGAYEFTANPIQTDVSLVNIDLPDQVCDGEYPLDLEMYNNGADTLDYLQLHWGLDEEDPLSITWTGLLPPDSTIILALDTLYLIQGHQHTISVDALVPNGSIDLNTNDNNLLQTVTVRPKPSPQMMPHEFLCPGNTVHLELDQAYSSYNWSNNETEASIDVGIGFYDVTVTDSFGCSASTGVYVSESDIIDKKFWLVYGDVEVIEVWNNNIYLGGNFDRATPYQKNLAALETNAGEMLPFPMIDQGQSVNVFLEDGEGGLFLGGEFSVIGGKPRHNLAHVNAVGQITDWRADANGPVHALLMDEGMLMVGGAFDTIGGKIRYALAEIHPQYAHVTPWKAPIFRTGQYVNTLARYKDKLLVGGSFSTEYSSKFYGIERKSGIFPPWNNTISVGGSGLPVQDIVVVGDEAFLSDPNILKLNLFGGQAEFISGLGGPELSFYNGQLFVPNDYGFKAYDLDSETVVWEEADFTREIIGLTIFGDYLYVYGRFWNWDGDHPEQGIWKYDLTTRDLLEFESVFMPLRASSIKALAIYDEKMIISGDFAGAGGKWRKNLLEMDGISGAVTDWNPQADGLVQELYTDLEHLYVGGLFEEISGQERNHLAAYDIDGQLSDWAPLYGANVYTMDSNDSLLFIGGSAITLNAGTLVAINKNTAEVYDGFRPGVGDYVDNLVVIDSVIAISGRLDVLYENTDSTYYLGARGLTILDTEDASFIDHFPAGQYEFINDMDYYNGQIFLGGRIDGMHLAPVQNLGAINTEMTDVSSWYPNLDHDVRELALGYGAAFPFGSFNEINGQEFINTAAISIQNDQEVFNFGLDNRDYSFGFYDMEIFDQKLLLGCQADKQDVEGELVLGFVAIDLRCLSEDIDLEALPSSDFMAIEQASTSLQWYFMNQSSEASKYLWDFGDGTSSTAHQPKHTYEQEGMYNVCLTAYHTTGQNEQCQMINARISHTRDIQNEGDWTLTPNPTNGITFLETQQDDLANHPWGVTVFDAQGQVVQQQELQQLGNRRELQMKNILPPGLYFCQISVEGVVYNVGRLVLSD